MNALLTSPPTLPPRPSSRPPRTLLVAGQLGGQCSHSGIHQLARHVDGCPRIRIIDTHASAPRRCVGRLWRLLTAGPARDQSVTFSELRAAAHLATGRFNAVHFLVGEPHLAPGAYRFGRRRPVILTLHFPASTRPVAPPRSGEVDTIIVLSTREIPYFRQAWGARRVVFIPHGVDTDFFQPLPGPPPPPDPPAILVVGRFLRDWALTSATVSHLAAAHPTWRFDFVVPPEAWHAADLATMRALPAVRWHDRISDDALLHLYQTSTCHLTPFIDCTANNGLVESLACGLPLVTTDRGGVRDYGGDTIFPLPTAPTATALAALCTRYATEPAWRARIAQRCRTFAVNELAWPVIARRHLDLYALATTPSP